MSGEDIGTPPQLEYWLLASNTVPSSEFPANVPIETNQGFCMRSVSEGPDVDADAKQGIAALAAAQRLKMASEFFMMDTLASSNS
jgi:hypothetical protein